MVEARLAAIHGSLSMMPAYPKRTGRFGCRRDLTIHKFRTFEFVWIVKYFYQGGCLTMWRGLPSLRREAVEDAVHTQKR